MQSLRWTCVVVLFAIQLRSSLLQQDSGGRKYLITLKSSSTTGEPILNVSTENLVDSVFFAGPGRISSYCISADNGCDLLVLKGSNSSETYTVFVPLINGAWMVTLSIGYSVGLIGESTLNFTSHCETLGVFKISRLFVAICTDENDYFHYCDLEVDLKNASSFINRCGGNPQLHRRQFQRANGVPVPNAVQIRDEFMTELVLLFSGTTVYHFSASDRQLYSFPIYINCDFIVRVQKLSSNNGSAYLYCNDSRIYLYNLLDTSQTPILVRDTFEGRYACNSGIYSITNITVLYQLPGIENQVIILQHPIVRAICIGNNSLLYEDRSSLNIIRSIQGNLEHTSIESRNFRYQVLRDLYVVLFHGDSISVIDANTLDLEMFRSSGTDFPPLMHLLSISINITMVTTSALQPEVSITPISTTTQTNGTASTTTLKPTSRQELPTSHLPNTEQKALTISLSVVLPIFFFILVIGSIIGSSCYCCHRRCHRRRIRATSERDISPSSVAVNESTYINSPESNSEGQNNASSELIISNNPNPVSDSVCSTSNNHVSDSEDSCFESPQSVSDTRSQHGSLMVGVAQPNRIPTENIVELRRTRRTEEYRNFETERIQQIQSCEDGEML